MTETTDKKCLLDLVPTGPVYSDVFEFGNPPRKFKFRLLDTAESLWCEVAAQRKTLDMLQDEFGDRDLAIDLMKTHAPNMDVHTAWQELFALQAALCAESGAPATEGSPDDRAQRMADLFSPIERYELAQLYAEFADEHDPTNISDEQIEEIVETEGPLLDPAFWRQLGSRVLRRCSLTMAHRLSEANQRIRQLESQIEELDPADPETSQTHKSSAG